MEPDSPLWATAGDTYSPHDHRLDFIGLAVSTCPQRIRGASPVDNFPLQPIAIGSAVVNLICSIAKDDDTSVSGAVAISRR
jgi:hypothetical protein